MGLINCPETSVRNYHCSLRNDPEERSSHLLSDGSLKSRIEHSLIPVLTVRFESELPRCEVVHLLGSEY